MFTWDLATPLLSFLITQHVQMGIHPGLLKQQSIVLPIIVKSQFPNHFYFLSEWNFLCFKARANASNTSSNIMKLACLMKCLIHLRWTIISKKLRKKKKIVFDVVWWSLLSSKLFIKQIFLYQTRFACLMDLSRISSKNLHFITALSAKHKRWSVFRHYTTFSDILNWKLKDLKVSPVAKKRKVNPSLSLDWIESVPPSLSFGEIISELLPKR